MRQDREGLALPVFFLSTGQILLARRMVTEEQDRRFGEGPREVRSADLRAGGAITLAGRLLSALDPAARGHESLPPREAGNVMPFIQEHETEDLANARD